jgi:RHS repeat-associated protein
LKRVKEVRAGKTIYTIYSRQTGSLLYRDEATDNIRTDYLSAGSASLRRKLSPGNPATISTYSYIHADAQGTPHAATDAAGNGASRSFLYDDLGRLTFATGPWGGSGASFVYDALGNLRTQQIGARLISTQFDAAKNRLSSLNDAAAGGTWRAWTYDASGNVTGNGRSTFTYDAANRPATVDGAAAFVYDGHGRRVKQTLWGKTIYSVYSQSGTLLHRRNVTDGVQTDYIRLGGTGETIARIRNGVATYTHADHLGSASAATNASGVFLWREDYLPFGEARLKPGENLNDEAFTGHVGDQATSLIYMQARYYDPAAGRFLSDDPEAFTPARPNMFNRYAYVANDPVNLWDPNGEDAEVAIRRNGFHAFVQITNKDNRLQTTIVRGGPNRDYSGASSGRSSGSSSGSTRGSSSSGSTGGTTGASAGGDSGDRASGSSSGDAGGSARLQLVGQVADIPNSIDGAAALDPNTVEVGSTTVSGDYSAVVGAAESFTNTINDAGLPYQVLDQNSNSFAGTAFEQITGEPRPENNSGGILPAYNTDLCKETQC